MGTKGYRQLDAAVTACTEFVEKIQGLEEISSRKMFGGYGVFEGGTMFAIVDSEGSVFLKVIDENLQRFEEGGGARLARMPYYSVPERTILDGEALLDKTQEAIESLNKFHNK